MSPRGQLGALFRSWLGALGQPASQVVTFDAMDRPWLREGRRRAFGTEAAEVHDLAAAKLLLSVGDDFVEEGSPVEDARGLAQLREGRLDQRFVEIARALCADPMLLLLDEPAAGLRHMEKQRLASLLRSLRDGGMSVLLVEHDMGFVMDLADRIVVLDFGTKIAEGTPATIKTNPEVIKAYLGVAA